MNKAVFLKNERFFRALFESGMWIKGAMIHVSNLSAPVTRVVISNTPLFIKNKVIIKELARFRKFTSSMRMILLSGETRPVLS